MNIDPTSRGIAQALAAELEHATRSGPKHLDPTIVARIRAKALNRANKIDIPGLPVVDDDTRMAARNGDEEGLSKELEEELRIIEDNDQKDKDPGLNDE